ncbi:M48 family metallopeptidase [Patescibacteria group bacterium]|nr:M48 family metallopeptidase [Patescibacteria group bacterium]
MFRTKRRISKLFFLKRKRRRVSAAPSKHYLAHKESARTLVHERLSALNAFYNFAYNKVAIRDQKSRWGSCSTKKNLNFNYRIQFLPVHLIDYIVAHELCHLEEFNHGENFWKLVEKAIPRYRECQAELRKVRMQKGAGLQIF